MYNEKVHYRASIFISKQIEINSENVTKISTVLNEFQLIPSSSNAIGFRLTSLGIKPETSISLEMKKVDESFKIVFGDNRIDIIRNKISEKDKLNIIDNFILEAEKVITLLIPTFNLQVFRCALCTNIIFDLTKDKLDKIYDMFANIKEDGGGITLPPIEWDIRNVRRKELESRKNIGVNYVSKFSRNKIQVGYEAVPIDRLLLELDINTVPTPGILFTENEIKMFWKDVYPDLLKIINSYVKKMKNEVE